MTQRLPEGPSYRFAGPGQSASQSRHGVINDPPQRLLNCFIGDWRLQGRNGPMAPGSPNSDVSGVDRYEWMPGGFFVSATFDHRFGPGSHEGMGILGWDADDEAFFLQNFDNLGYQRKYRVAESHGIWTFSGDSERCTCIFSEDGSSWTQSWEFTKDGETWFPLCTMRATKVS